MELKQIKILLFFLEEELKEVPNHEEWVRVNNQINMLLFKEALIKKTKNEKSIFRIGG